MSIFRINSRRSGYNKDRVIITTSLLIVSTLYAQQQPTPFSAPNLTQQRRIEDIRRARDIALDDADRVGDCRYTELYLKYCYPNIIDSDFCAKLLREMDRCGYE